MFWIHGGGFYTGSGNTDFFGPDYLITENVVLVTINYRLGPLGKKLLFIFNPCDVIILKRPIKKKFFIY